MYIIVVKMRGDLSAHPSEAGCPPGSRQGTPGSGRFGPAPPPASRRRRRTPPCQQHDFVSF